LLAASLAAQHAPIGERIAALTQRVEAQRLRANVEALAGFETRHVLSATDDDDRGTGAARRWLEEKMRSCGGRLQIERKTYRVPSQRLGREVEVVDIVAILPGVGDPERVYVVGGHYDSINSDPRDGEGQAPGANDDGSGTAAVLEACRVLADERFAATILFVCYDGEEQGLLGSTAHADDLAARAVAVDGMITNDIVGNTLGMDGVRRTDYLRCFSYAPTGNDSDGRSLARAAARAAREHVPGFELRIVYRGDRYGRGGDHRPFYAQGWPAVRFTEPREDFSRQHRNVTERDGQAYGDVPAWVDFDYLARVCAVNVALLAELAAAPPPPRELRVQGARESYDTELSWPAVEGAHAYAAVWRETTAADWQESRVLAGDEVRTTARGLSATLRGVCLDDVVVGICSVGADGARSRATTPPEPDAFNLRRSTGRRR
jgi:hypothetical protein